MTVKINMASGLKNARKAANKSVDEVGAVVGKSGKTISAWEVGRGQPDGDELILICDFLNCHLSDFYGEEYKNYLSESIDTNELSDDEIKIIEQYRKCNEIGKRSIRSFSKAAATEFPANDDIVSLEIKSDMSHEEIYDFYNAARNKGMTDEQILNMLKSLTDLFNSGEIDNLPMINPVEQIAKRTISN